MTCRLTSPAAKRGHRHRKLAQSGDVPAARAACHPGRPGRCHERRTVELGIGAGSFEGEHVAYGIPFPERGGRPLPDRRSQIAVDDRGGCSEAINSRCNSRWLLVFDSVGGFDPLDRVQEFGLVDRQRRLVPIHRLHRILFVSILHWFPRQFRLNSLRAVRPLDHVLTSAARSHERVNQRGGTSIGDRRSEVPAPLPRSALVPRACISTPTMSGIQSGNLPVGSSSDTHHRRNVRIGHRPCTRDPSLYG